MMTPPAIIFLIVSTIVISSGMATSTSTTNRQTDQEPLLSNRLSALLDQDPADLDHPLIISIASNDLPSFHSLLPTTPPFVLTAALNLCLRTNKPPFIPPLLTNNAPFNPHTALEAIRGQNSTTLYLLLSPPHSMSPQGTGTSGHIIRPIELALCLNNPELVSILLAHGADIDSHEFEVALMSSSPELVKLLIETSAEAKYQVYRVGALQVAAGAGKLEIVKFLLGLPGMAVDGKPRGWRKGTTALMEAIGKGRVEVVGCLLMNGADPELGSGEGEGSFKKPEEVARELEDGEEKTEILELLNIAGGDVQEG